MRPNRKITYKTAPTEYFFPCRFKLECQLMKTKSKYWAFFCFVCFIFYSVADFIWFSVEVKFACIRMIRLELNREHSATKHTGWMCLANVNVFSDYNHVQPTHQNELPENEQMNRKKISINFYKDFEILCRKLSFDCFARWI